MSMRKNLLNIKEAANYLGVTVGTLYQWRYMQRIPYVKIGGKVKFDLDRVNAWLENNSVEPDL